MIRGVSNMRFYVTLILANIAATGLGYALIGDVPPLWWNLGMGVVLLGTVAAFVWDRI